MEGSKITAGENSGRFTRTLRLAHLVTRIALGALFVFAGAAKIFDPGEFANEVRKYNLLPWILDVLLALYLPWMELLAGLCLVLKIFEKGALLVITVLLAVFTLALATAMFRGLNIDCGCFGKALTSTGTAIPLLRNLLLLTLAGFIWRENK